MKPFDDFLTELKIVSKNCNFCNTAECLGSLLRDRIVSGILSDAVRERLLAEKTLTLEKAVDLCRSAEKAQDGVAELKNLTSETVDGVGEFQSRRVGFRNRPNQGSGKKDLLTCKFCLRKHPFGREKCPA